MWNLKVSWAWTALCSCDEQPYGLPCCNSCYRCHSKFQLTSFPSSFSDSVISYFIENHQYYKRRPSSNFSGEPSFFLELARRVLPWGPCKSQRFWCMCMTPRKNIAIIIKLHNANELGAPSPRTKTSSLNHTLCRVESEMRRQKLATTWCKILGNSHGLIIQIPQTHCSSFHRITVMWMTFEPGEKKNVIGSSGLLLPGLSEKTIDIPTKVTRCCIMVGQSHPK